MSQTQVYRGFGLSLLGASLALPGCATPPNSGDSHSALSNGEHHTTLVENTLPTAALDTPVDALYSRTLTQPEVADRVRAIVKNGDFLLNMAIDNQRSSPGIWIAASRGTSGKEDVTNNLRDFLADLDGEMNGLVRNIEIFPGDEDVLKQLRAFQASLEKVRVTLQPEYLATYWGQTSNGLSIAEQSKSDLSRVASAFMLSDLATLPDSDQRYAMAQNAERVRIAEAAARERMVSLPDPAPVAVVPQHEAPHPQVASSEGTKTFTYRTDSGWNINSATPVVPATPGTSAVPKVLGSLGRIAVEHEVHNEIRDALVQSSTGDAAIGAAEATEDADGIMEFLEIVGAFFGL